MKIVLLLCFAFTLSQVYAQDIQIDEKKFQTVKKTVLAGETEFYQLKEKGKAGAKTQSYVKTEGQFHKTIFTETELKSFFLTGKGSSLGIVNEKKLHNDKKVTYIIKQNDVIIISKVNNTVKFLEIYDNLLAQKLIGKDAVAKSNDNGGEPGSDDECPGDCCAGDCLCEWAGCTAENSAGCIFETPEQRQACVDGFAKCLENCSDAPERVKPGKGFNMYAIKLTGIAVKLK